MTLEKCFSMYLPYFWNTKTHSFFRVSFCAALFFPLMNALVYVNTQHRPGHSLGEKNRAAQNEKQKKNTWVFTFHITKIW